MFLKLSRKSKVHNILVVSLTNIGDVIAICPAMDILLNDFPAAKVSVIVGPKGRTVFEGNPNIERVIIYDKHAPIRAKADWLFNLRLKSFDVVVDFRNSFLPFLLSATYRTPPELFISKSLHLTEKHLVRLRSLYDFHAKASTRRAIVILPKDREYVDGLLSPHISPNEKFVLIAPVAADSAKTWDPKNFSHVCDELIERHSLKVVMVGSSDNIPTMKTIQRGMRHSFLNFAGRTNLVQVAELLNRSLFGIVHDSGIMHLASYFNRQVLALFGPTDPRLSGPWSENSGYIWKNQSCVKCLDRKINQLHTCMQSISPEDVLNSIELTPSGVHFKTELH